MQPPDFHSKFFFSLKQVEKRLKLSHNLSHSSIPSSQSQEAVPESNYVLTSTDQSVLSSPLHLHFDQTSPNLQESSSSEPPLAFLSQSPQFPQIRQNPLRVDLPETTHDEETDSIDDVQKLMQLLGLKDEFQEVEKGDDFSKCCECEGGFYEKIIGVKGPKCEKEVERMEGWIQCFLRSSDSDCEEPLRLAYLLLGKAAFVGSSDGGFEGLEFPSTVDEFLKNDPPNE